MHRRKTYTCGGYSSYSGHCGALDCETCHPGGAAEMARQEELEPLEQRLQEIETLMEDLDEDSEEFKTLDAEAEELRSDIEDWNHEPAWEARAECYANDY